MKNLFIAVLILLSIAGCVEKKLEHADSFPSAVELIADQLYLDRDELKKNKILFTSLVDLNDFKESSKFGRLFSESLMTEMKSKGFDIIEYRGNNLVSKNLKGEFRLNRSQTQNLKDDNYSLLIGTYSKMDDNVIVNIRIIDQEDGILLSAASVYIPLLTHNETKKTTHKIKTFHSHIIKSKCSTGERCWREINE